MSSPQFPNFKPLELEDKPVFNEFLQTYHPETSELSFTNLFIWRKYYSFSWSIYDQWLYIIASKCLDSYAYQPIGPASREGAVLTLLEWLRDEKKAVAAYIDRADLRLVNELSGNDRFVITPQREHFDYVYSSEDLIHLRGRRFHTQKNHLNKFKKTTLYTYAPLTPQYFNECKQVTEEWFAHHGGEGDSALVGERKAIYDLLDNYEHFSLKGGVLTIGDSVEAFTIGEMLNNNTAVIHIEKADPKISYSYTAINQQFVEHAWSHVPFINREQDLGIPSLQRAKQSYHPVKLVEKFRIELK